MPGNKKKMKLEILVKIYIFWNSLYSFCLSYMNWTTNWTVSFLSEFFNQHVSVWFLLGCEYLIYVSEKHAALKLNIVASSYNREHFCTTCVLWRPFPYWLWEWDKGYIHIISWLEQGCCFCEQLQHRKILAGKILSFVLHIVYEVQLYLLISINKLIFFQARGPQCALYVPAPILRPGDNIVVRSLSILITFMRCLVMLLFSFCCTSFCQNCGEIALIHLSMQREVFFYKNVA